MPVKPLEAPRTAPASETETRHAPLWRVLLHNDNTTPMDGVIGVLMKIFAKSFMAATKIMLEAHFTGVAHVVTETQEQAEFHIDQAHSFARARKWVLTFTMEPEA